MTTAMHAPTTYRILSCHTGPVGPEWHDQLVGLMGSKPRRLSRWCELGLWGALSCLHRIALEKLPSEVPIRVYSETGTANATQKALTQLDEYLPLPVTFMQTLPGQLFNAIGTALHWHGDGCTVAGAARGQTEIALLNNIQTMTLLAWVDELPLMESRWVLLEQSQSPTSATDWQPLASIFAIVEGMQYLQLHADGQLFQGR